MVWAGPECGIMSSYGSRTDQVAHHTTPTQYSVITLSFSQLTFACSWDRNTKNKKKFFKNVCSLKSFCQFHGIMKIFLTDRSQHIL